MKNKRGSPESDRNISPSFRGKRTCAFVSKSRGGVTKSSSDDSSDGSERFRLKEGATAFPFPLLSCGGGGEGVESGEDRRRMEGAHT